jgi:hypothetical protein
MEDLLPRLKQLEVERALLLDGRALREAWRECIGAQNGEPRGAARRASLAITKAAMRVVNCCLASSLPVRAVA